MGGVSLKYNCPPSARTCSDKWMEYGLPIGNGHLGAVVMGGLQRAEIQLNEKTFWTGSPKVKGSYQNLGYLTMLLANATTDVPDDYRIELSLDEAVVRETWSDNGTSFSREYLASFPDDCLAIHFTASTPQDISIALRGTHGENVSYSLPCIAMSSALESVTATTVVMIHADGNTIADTESINIQGATDVFVVLSVGTDYSTESPTYRYGWDGQDLTDPLVHLTSMCRATVTRGWPSLVKSHIYDYQALYQRMSLEFDEASSDLLTDSLIMRYPKAQQAERLALEQLYFSYGRYLLIASSRGMSLPNNLQGLWCNSNTPPWSSDIHANINIQMNYWPALVTNLGETEKPLLDWIYDSAMCHNEWRATAAALGEPGWLCYWGLNIFGFSSKPKEQEHYCAAPAWLCWHLWQHYLYTLDEDFLANRALPVMLGCVEFWMHRLVLDENDGLWVCPKEWSPEQGPLADGTAHTQQCVWMLFSATLKALDIVGAETAGASEELLEDIREKFGSLDNGLHTEIYDGRYGQSVNGVQKGDVLLREWKHLSTTTTAKERQHRHVSHLMCLYPFSMVQPGDSLMPAVVNSMLLRGERNTGWAMAWKLNLWARARRADMAYAALGGALNHARTYNVSTDPQNAGVYYNLLDAHPPFQIDGNFGVCAGMAEMLMQSYADTLRLLPALPDAWKSGGCVRGICAEGGYELDFEWEDDQVTELTLRASHDGVCRLQVPTKEIAYIVDESGQQVAAPSEEQFLEFMAEAGATYHMTFTRTGVDHMLVPENYERTIYDLAGRRIISLPTRSGVYIINGKKVLLK